MRRVRPEKPVNDFEIVREQRDTRDKSNTPDKPVEETVSESASAMYMDPGYYGPPVRLAEAWVPWQTFSRTLELSEALKLGSLFPELVRTPPLYGPKNRG